MKIKALIGITLVSIVLYGCGGQQEIKENENIEEGKYTSFTLVCVVVCICLGQGVALLGDVALLE